MKLIVDHAVPERLVGVDERAAARPSRRCSRGSRPGRASRSACAIAAATESPSVTSMLERQRPAAAAGDALGRLGRGVEPQVARPRRRGPSAASARAIARPMPPPPPVTSATRPDTRRSSHARTTREWKGKQMQELTDVRYEVEHGLALDHDRPSGAHERVPRPHGRRADPLPQARVGERRRSAWSASPARASARSAPAATRSSAPRPATTARRSPGLFEVEYAAPADPRAAEAGDRRGERLRDRRRPRAARAVRPHDRRGHRASSARPARAWARSTPASAPPTSRASSARSARARSGSCAASTTPRRPSAGAS